MCHGHWHDAWHQSPFAAVLFVVTAALFFGNIAALAAGLVPRVEDFDMTGLSLAKEKLERLFEVNIKEWKSEVDEVRAFLKPYKGRLPAEIREQYEKLERQVR